MQASFFVDVNEDSPLRAYSMPPCATVCHRVPPCATVCHHRDRTFSANFVRRQRGFATLHVKKINIAAEMPKVIGKSSNAFFVDVNEDSPLRAPSNKLLDHIFRRNRHFGNFHTSLCKLPFSSTSTRIRHFEATPTTFLGLSFT